MKSQQRDLRKQLFGALFVLDRNPLIGSNEWACLCTCGHTTSIAEDDLLSGKITHCGCVHTATPDNPRKGVYVYKGVEHTVSEIAKLAGITRESVYWRFRKWGIDVARVVETKPQVRGKFKYGDEHVTIKAISERLGTPYSTIKSRIKSGISFERACRPFRKAVTHEASSI